MTRHARAVILLGGWLLMLPPTVKDPQDRARDGFGWRAVTDAPITKWEQFQAYDTAAECKAAKAGAEWYQHSRERRLRREAEETKGTDPAAAAHAFARGLEDDLARDAAAYANTRCVPAEAVYPPHQQPSTPEKH